MTCGVSPQFVVAVSSNSRCFDLLWICNTTNPQQFTTNRKSGVWTLGRLCVCVCVCVFYVYGFYAWNKLMLCYAMLWSSNRSLELFDRIRYNRHVALNCFVPLYGLQYQATSVTNLPSLLTAHDWLVTLIIRLPVSVTVTRYTSTLSVSLSGRRSRSCILPKQINIFIDLIFPPRTYPTILVSLPVNHFKPSGVKWLHFKVFKTIPV